MSQQHNGKLEYSFQSKSTFSLEQSLICQILSISLTRWWRTKEGYHQKLMATNVACRIELKKGFLRNVLKDTYVCVSGSKKCSFFGKFGFVFFKQPFWDSPFCLITDVIYFSFCIKVEIVISFQKICKKCSFWSILSVFVWKTLFFTTTQIIMCAYNVIITFKRLI